MDESEAGACGIAAPLIDPNGHLLDAFAIGLPSIRMMEKKGMLIKAVTQLVREAAGKLFDDANQENDGAERWRK